jgi:hypothetical protein
MSNTVRKLATVREIKEIRQIAGADSIEVAIVDGWECVVKKSDAFKAGDKVVYIEVDSIVPERPEFEFLRDRKFRVKTIKLRKQISQGLVISMDILGRDFYSRGEDVTDVLGITKHDPEADQEAKLLQSKTLATKNPLVKFLLRFSFFRKFFVKSKKGGFPAWIKKTDESRIQNLSVLFEIERNAGTKFSVTEKIDGQSATYFLERRGKKYHFGVCSRNILLKNPNESSYWTIAKQLNIEDVLRQLIGNHDRVVLQGEILGNGIQGNKYGIVGYKFYAFNLIYPNKKVTTGEMTMILKMYGIDSVVLVDNCAALPETISELVDLAKGESTLAKTKREGLVFRNYAKNISFKVINPEFLLAEKD